VPSTMEDVAEEVAAASAVEASRSVTLNDRARRSGAVDSTEVTERAKKRRRAVVDEGERELEQMRVRQQHALDTVARASANIARLEEERVQLLQRRAAPTPVRAPVVPHRAAAPQRSMAELMALPPAIRAREILKKRVEMHNLRAMMLRHNALMMQEMAVAAAH
jgi:hypothetical protein